MSVVATAQSNLTAKVNNFQPAAVDGANNDSDRARDGLVGPVRRVRTEVVKVSNASGKVIEDNKRVLLETAEYDLKGAKTQNQYFPVAGSALTGRETYKYDDKGNISEMTLLNGDGSLLSKETYKYEFDSIGNWVKMTTAVAVVENQKIVFDPTEVTYRTIFYYLDASMAKMMQPSNNASVPLPPSSMNNIRVSSVQPPGANLSNANSAKPERVALTGEGDAPAPRILRPVSGGVLNGKALSLPLPLYPQIAMRARTAGKVEVEVIVDENGKVISAQAVSGPGLLRDAAIDAAKRARFSPTKLSGAPVKVVGLINYNFTLP
jgi:TonB family protein